MSIPDMDDGRLPIEFFRLQKHVCVEGCLTTCNPSEDYCRGEELNSGTRISGMRID